MSKESQLKFDLKSIVDEVQEHYKKDKRSQSMITTGDTIRQEYTLKDGVPVPEEHPLRELVGLPVAPYNKIIQFSGLPDGGKSTCSAQLMASAQKTGHFCVLWDSEDKFDAKRFDSEFGGISKQVALVKTNEILQGGEKVRKIVITAMTKYPGTKIHIVWDSVGGSQGRGAAERELDDEKHASPAQEARENGVIMRMFIGLINKYPDSIAITLVNQVHSKIGFMMKGDKETGGKKVEFHSSMIIRFKPIKVLTKVVKGRLMKYGMISRATVLKNHLTQTKLSLHQLDFEITAAGAKVSGIQNLQTEDEDND